MSKERVSGLGLSTRISIIILSGFFVLVPILRCQLFFDSYLIKFWVVQAGVAVVFILFCYRRPETPLPPGIITLLLAYLVINFISWVIIPLPYRYVASPALIAVITYIMMCFFVSQYLVAPDRAVGLWILATVWPAFLGIYQHSRGLRVIGTLGNENFLASHLVLTIPVVIGYFWRYLGERYGGIKKAVLLGTGAVVLLIFGASLGFTASRGGWLGLSAGLAGFCIILGVPRGKRMLAAVIVVLVVLVLAGTPAGIEFIAEQFQGDVRPPIWEASTYMIAMKPWLGWGKGAFFIFYPQFRVMDYWLARGPTDLTIHAHNEYLHIWAETGIIGLIIFLALVTGILRAGIQKIDRQKEPAQRYLAAGMVCGVISLLVHNLVCNNLQIPSSAIFLWLTLGLILGMGMPFPERPGQAPRRLIALVSAGIMAIIIWCLCIRPATSQYLFKQGWNYRSDGDWVEAIEKYGEAISWYPWDAEMYYRTAYACAQSGEMRRAIEEYKDVCKLAPDYGNVHRNMGVIYMKLGEYRLATQCLLKARQINPYDTATLHYLTMPGKLDDSK